MEGYVERGYEAPANLNSRSLAHRLQVVPNPPPSQLIPRSPPSSPRKDSGGGFWDWGLPAHALATPNPSHSRRRHMPHTSSKPPTTSPHTRPASRSSSRFSHSPRSIHRMPSSRISVSFRHSASASFTPRSRRPAMPVLWRDMCRESER